MSDDGRRAENRARHAKQFQYLEDSLARVTDLIDQSKREVERSRQIMKDADAADDRAHKEADKERDDDARRT